MKTFTARQLNSHRNEIKEALIKDGKCVIQFKDCDRSVAIESILTIKTPEPAPSNR